MQRMKTTRARYIGKWPALFATGLFALFLTRCDSREDGVPVPPTIQPVAPVQVPEPTLTEHDTATAPRGERTPEENTGEVDGDRID